MDVEDFLAYVHDLPLQDYLTPDPTLRSGARFAPDPQADLHQRGRFPRPTRPAALELDGLFDAIVDVNTVAPYCKPMPESFGIAMQAAGETDPRAV